MNLVQELIKDLLPEQEYKKTVAVYGGGFKPPTKGHFKVVKQAIKENPDIDEFIINIGGKARDGVTPEEAIQIWDIYKQYLPVSANINIQYSSTPPIKATYDYAKNHPDEEVLFIIGAREGNDDDFKDIASRTTSLDKYPNLNLRTIVTQGGVSGTAARQAGKISSEKLRRYLPDELSDEEVEQVYQMISDKLAEGRKKKKDPKKGTGKKPKGSSRRLYTDEDPKDTVGIKFSTRQDIVDTLNKKSFKAKSHARQSQIINLIHQRTRAAYNRSKKPDVKKRLKTALDYITKRKEASKKKTQRLKKQKLKEGDTIVKLTPQEKKIADDILLGLNEGALSGVLDKMKKYASKGLLTLAILSSVTQGLQAQGTPQNDIDTINQQGIELIQQINTSDQKSEKLVKDQLGKNGLKQVQRDAEELGSFFTATKGNNRNIIKARATQQAKLHSNNQGSIQIKDSSTYRTSDGQMLYIMFYQVNSINENFKAKQKINEAIDSSQFDFAPYIASLTQHMMDNGMKLEPLPKIQMIHDDYENGEDLFGKTAYYAPATNLVVLYTYGRHPKDILRSYAHELVHVHQNMEDRLHTINTTDVNQDDHLEQLEREAYETGNIMFRSWTDSLTGNKLEESVKQLITEKKKKDPFGLNAYALELAKGMEEQVSNYKVYLDMDGVLADFDQRFKDISGMEPKEFEDKYGKKAFWDLIDEDNKISFWVGIKPMPGAAALVNAVKNYNYELLTSPSSKKQSYLGKILWVRNHSDILGGKPRINFKKAKEKHEVKPELSKTDILIDDREDTIGRWNAAGGTGIVYKNIGQVLGDLKKLGL